jgi:hypothetical protein
VEHEATGPTPPLRVLLVSDDLGFVEQLRRVAASTLVELAVAGPNDDLELAAYGHGAGVGAVDADEAPLRRVRLATALSGVHPRVTVVLLASRPESLPQTGLPLVAKTPVEEILWKLDHVRQGQTS